MREEIDTCGYCTLRTFAGITVRSIQSGCPEHSGRDSTVPRRVRTQAERAGDDHTWRAAADHPHTDPGDGRTECDRCGKYVWPAIHSCKGVPVTDRARTRLLVALGTADCCICDPNRCADDDTGQHCADRSCGWCLHGCPAPEGEPCCQDGANR